ncbi:ribosomal protein S18-alanine N-acetyltransferase [soil metagenome]
MAAVPRPSGFQIEAMLAAHLDAIVAIEEAAYPFPWTRGNFADSLSSGYGAWVLVDAGVVIGYAIVMKALDESHLLNITIAPDHQGRGAGAWLLRQILESARRQGARRLFLEVRPSNQTARRLYARFGFAQMGVRKRYYPDHDGKREDALVMTVDFR